jgi:hypothetical protein
MTNLPAAMLCREPTNQAQPATIADVPGEHTPFLFAPEGRIDARKNPWKPTRRFHRLRRGFAA